MTTDTRLLTRLLDGDRDAFEQVYAATFPAVHAFAARHTRDRAEAETLTERILRRVFAALPLYAGDVPFAAWLLEQARGVERAESLRRRPARVRARPPIAHLAPR